MHEFAIYPFGFIFQKFRKIPNRSCLTAHPDVLKNGPIMHHKKKTAVFKCLSLLPHKLGDNIYHHLQRMAENTPVIQKIELTNESYQKLMEVFDAINVDLEGKKVVEIGSGWLPIMPYFLKYFGKCQEVLTYDVREHYNSTKIEEFNKAFFSEYAKMAIPEAADKKYNLPSGIKYFPLTDFTHDPPPAKSVDVIISRYVLEHISPEDLLTIHTVAKQCLKDEGALCHLVGSNDHRAFSDKTLSLYDFLRYSQKEWDKIQTRFDYHNRLRLPEYEEIFKKAGFSIAYTSYSSARDNDLLAQNFNKVDIHPDYKKFNITEVTAASLIFGLRI